MKETGLKENSRGVGTPGVHESKDQRWEEEEEGGALTKYRGIAARAIYLGQDRVDIQFAAKEISRFMRVPEKQDWAKAKRLARYLLNQKRQISGATQRDSRVDRLRLCRLLGNQEIAVRGSSDARRALRKVV